MTSDFVSNFEWIGFFVMSFITLLLFSQAYVNLFKKRYTKFGLDAFSISVVKAFTRKQRREFVSKYNKDPERVRTTGIQAILLAIGFAWGTIQIWFNVIEPHLK